MIFLALVLVSLSAAQQELERPTDTQRTPVRESRLVGWPDPVPDGYTRLALDALIDLLPPVIRSGRRVGVAYELHPIEFEFQRRVLDGVELTSAQWFRVLQRTQKLRYRSRWPVTEPIMIELWNPSVRSRSVRLVPRIEGWPVIRFPIFDFDGGCGMGADTDRGGITSLHERYRALSLGGHALEFDLEVADSRGEIELDFEIVPDLDSAMPPVTGAAIDAVVRASFGVVCQPTDGTLGDVVLRCEAALELDPQLAHVAVCADVERLRDGEVVGMTTRVSLPEIDMRMRAARGGASIAAEIVTRELERIPPACLRDEHERARWSLRVTSTTSGVLTKWWCDRYWSGSFVLPLGEAMQREAVRSRR